MLLPRQKVPDLTIPTLDHGPFDLSQDNAEMGTIVCFTLGCTARSARPTLRSLKS